MRDSVSSTADRPIGALLIAAGAVALVTVGVVLRFGLVPPPALDPVDTTTRPEVALALASYRDPQRGQCIHVVAVDGSVREVRCSMDGGPLVGWDERGILIVRYGPVGERLDAIDPTTGAVVSSSVFDPSVTMPARWDDSLAVERDGRTLVVRDDDRSVLWAVTAPDAYRINATARDPRTGMIALLDEAGRLLVLPAGGGAPRVWADDVGVRYGELVWQGTALTSD